MAFRPTDEQLALGGLALGGTLALLWQTGALAVAWDFVGRGARLSYTEAGADGLITTDVDELAYDASQVLGFPVTVDQIVCARMVRSEQGGASEDTKRFLIWTSINDGAAFGPRHGLPAAPSSTILWDNNAAGRGRCGPQLPGRRYSTAQDPFENDLRVAIEVLAAAASGAPDPTGGAVKFADVTDENADLPAQWAADGLAAFKLPGTPSALTFFRRDTA